jgi:hypothetical protein
MMLKVDSNQRPSSEELYKNNIVKTHMDSLRDVVPSNPFNVVDYEGNEDDDEKVQLLNTIMRKTLLSPQHNIIQEALQTYKTKAVILVDSTVSQKLDTRENRE